MSWEIVVGIETHVQLLTRSKIFSGAATAFGAPPNTQASAVDIALPGVLPVLNRAAVEHAIRFGLAVGATVNRRSIFARKNYFYPDLPKGYQISQYEVPIVSGGTVRIVVDGTEKTIRLTRAHLEEDAGKSIHGEEISGIVGLGVVGKMIVGKPLANLTGVDLNRAGTPLLEIVSEPDLRGAKESVAYARALHRLVMWIGICDGNMQEGSFRCDANVSVRRQGDRLGTRCEIKNLNSFRFMEQAIEFEARRQIEILESGGTIEQETRLYDPQREETRSMRTKEEAHDYRYFPDPDLLPLEVSQELLGQILLGLPELPDARRARFVNEYAVTEYEAAILTNSRPMADFFESITQELTALGAPKREAAKMSASWLGGEISNVLNADQIDIDESGLDPKWLATLLIRIQDGTISRASGRAIFVGMSVVARNRRTQGITGVSNEPDTKQFSVDELIAQSGLKQISDAGSIEKLVDEVLAKNARQAEDYRAGKEKAFNSLVGQVMKATQGKANPAQVNEILRKKLGG